MNPFKKEIAALLADVLETPEEAVQALLEFPPDPAMGDIALPCFRFSKERRQPPARIAQELAEQLSPQGSIAAIKSTGPYLNFFLDKNALAQTVIAEILGNDAYGSSDEGSGRTIVIDFSSPNIAKPFGIGHLRSTVIGNAIRNLYEKLGYKVVAVNHLGDWGTQFGKLIVAYRKWGDEEKLAVAPIDHLFELYVKFHKEAQDNQKLSDDARQAFRMLEEGDEAVTELWKQFRALSLEAFDKIYGILGVRFDSYDGEAFYNDKLADFFKLIEEKKITTTSQDALIVDLKKYKMSPCLLRKKDEATLYATRDLAAAIYRKKTYDFSKCVYVVGSPQKLHFRQLFKVLELMGFAWHKDMVHVDFGQIRFRDEKMSTREGNVILLEEVLEKACSLVERIIKEKNPALEDRADVARIVGVGAVVFADLSSKRVRDCIFDWDEILSFEGETGPYVQYTYVRTCGILKKFARPVPETADTALLDSESEKRLASFLTQYPDAVRRAAAGYEPSLIAQYLLELSSLFNSFYHAEKVITEDAARTAARIQLVACVRWTTRDGLAILGIQTVEEM